jgi:ABC-2 type transport system permease protein
MRYALLIAWREFAETVKTRGFWLSICLFPAIIVLAVQIPLLIEKKGLPTRHYVLVDRTGELAPVIRAALATSEQRRVEAALRAFARTAPYQEPFAYYLSSNRVLDLPQWQATQGTNWSQVRGFVPPRPRFVEVDPPVQSAATAGLDVVAEALRPWLRGEQKVATETGAAPLFAAVLIPADLPAQAAVPASHRGANGPVGLQYWSDNLADTALLDLIEGTVNAELRRRAYAERGLDSALVRALEETRAPVTSLNPKKAVGEEQVGGADRLRQWLPSAFVYLLWVAIFTIAQMLLTSVIEEKSNRIIEVLLSSVTPGELMVGKLMGIAAAGLTMLATWIGALVLVLAWQSLGLTSAPAAATGPLARLPLEVAEILQTTWLLPAFGLYFVLGYLLYAGLIIALGSTCNTLKEAQSFMGVIVVLLMVPLFTMTFIPRDPNGPLATALSWFPPYTPFVMMNRVTADPPLRDVVGTLILLIAFTGLVLWGAGRIFRIGVLRTGQPPKLVELLRWLRRP